ncbi:MAG TPA: c-type cytochrome [Terriglobia bacterium]|jgi:cytochrome c oxidase cbb3-type subunit 3|nr:c-type cytochrome [Terriglobia bacterium]
MKRSGPRSGVILALAAGFAMILSGCNNLPGRPGEDPVPRPDEVLDFKTLYSENCSACHGAAGKGGAAVSLGDPVYQALVDDDTLRQVITNGRTGTLMPAFGQSAGGMLTDHQVDALVHGMRTRWANPSALGGNVPPPYTASAPGDAAHGAGVYQASCAMCHGPSGRGGPVAGSIVDGSFLGLVPDQELRTMIIVGVPGTAMPDWRSHVPGPLSSQDISDVVAWLGAQRPQFPGQPYAASGFGPANGGSQ